MSAVNPPFSPSNIGAKTQRRDLASRLPRPLGQFWRWWAGELSQVFSPMIEKYWVDHSNVVSVAAESTNGVVSLASSVRLSGKDVRILLPRDAVLQKTVNYPEAVAENLAEVVANDLDRQTPFTPAQVYLAHRLTRRIEGGDGVPRIDVELTIAMKKIADAAIAKVVEAGGRVYSLGIVGDTLQTELLPESARPARRLSRLQKINIALFVVLCALIAVAVLAPIIMKRNDIKAISPLVDKARSEAEYTRKIEAEYQRLQTEYQIAVGKKYANYQVVDILEDLTKLSPDTTWMQSFELKTIPAAKAAGSNTPKPPIREIKLEGEATSAAKMIELIEQSRFLQNTTQRAQTNRGAQPNTEFFRLSTEVRPRPAPELVDLLAAPEPAAPTAVPSAPKPDAPPTAALLPTTAPTAAPTPTKDAKADTKTDGKADGKLPAKNGAPTPTPNPATSAPPMPANTAPGNGPPMPSGIPQPPNMPFVPQTPPQLPVQPQSSPSLKPGVKP